MSEITQRTATETVRLLQDSELSQAEVFAAYRDRIDRFDGEIGSYLWRADEASDTSAPRSGLSLGGVPLGGVPLAVKDVFCTAGVPSTAASRILEDYRPPYTATAVRRLEEAGATVLGKTNMDEFAMGSSNENSAFGAVRNPWDYQCVPGGSSGGSAAAVAAGLAPWAIGTDTGGSVRQPASLCGIVGLKPTYGAVSRYGMIAFASSLDQCGPLTQDVTDAALLLRHMVGHDPCDSTSVGLAEPIELPTKDDLNGVRFGVPAELTSDGVSAGVRELLERTLRTIESLGGQIEEIHLPHVRHGIAAYYVIAPAEASANLARFDGVRYGRRENGDGDLVDMYELTRADGFGDEVKRRIMLGTYALSSGFYEAYYGRAQKVRTKISQDFRTAFERFDYVVTPTSPTVAFKLGERSDDPWAMYLSDYCTVPMPLAGIPAISIPVGLSEGLPVGFQICGPPFSEQGILETAYALEQAIGFDQRPEVFGRE